MNAPDIQVIIIGAGIAGLTAAWQLKKLGIHALVLEANQIVGGRNCCTSLLAWLCD
jgi:monoamine oxidase